MALTSGTRFGPYEITGSLGAGGMGEVYRATDTNLKRDVAIKVLPASFASDEERLARFQREAEVLASLNHPNIAQIYGLERVSAATRGADALSSGEDSAGTVSRVGISAADDSAESPKAESAGITTALIMELVEGPTLADRIEQGPIPADEAIHIAMQIVDALEAAHEQNIVHRDLKPANVKLRPDGTVKVLDFGIAKALETQTGISGPSAPQLTTPAMTQAGLVLGTAAYMAPEQARGKPVDQRADIWAFGCVLYEMLTGQPAFGGEDVPITLARVLAYDADMKTIPETIAPHVRQTIELCLRKEPKKRLHSIGDVRLALAGELVIEAAGSRGEEAGKDVGAAIARPFWHKPLPVGAAALVAGAALAGVAVLGLQPEPEPPRVSRFAYVIPTDLELRNQQFQIVTLSPDGGQFVFNTDDGLYARRLNELEAQPIAGTEAGLVHPFFSPDGASLAYFSAGNLVRVAATGGAAVRIGSNPAQPMGGSWAADGTIFFAQPDGIYSVPATGGSPELIIPSDGAYLYEPQLLPDGDSLLFSAAPPASSTWDVSDIVVQSLATGERRVLVNGGSDARYVSTGHIVYAFEQNLLGIAFDPETLSISGGAVPLVQGLVRSVGGQTGTANYEIASNGTLVYLKGELTSQNNTLVWVDREDGSEEPINAPPRAYQYAQLSADGSRIGLDVRDQENDIWIWDVERETLQRLTFDPGINRGVTWSPDGSRIAFSRAVDASEEVYWQAADGSGTAEQLTRDSVSAMMPNAFTPDGTRMLYMTVNQPRDILMVDVNDSSSAAETVLGGSASEQGAAISPDGRWLAYQSNESGQDEVYVRPFPDVDSGRWQISTSGGTRPLWSRDGSELFYFVQSAGGATVMAAGIDAGDSFVPGAPQTVFSGPYLAPNQGRHVYDVSPDGQRFLMIKAVGGERQAPRREIIVVENWFEELKRLVPVE